MDDPGQEVAQGLAGPGLRNPHHVLPGQGDGEPLGLDGGGGSEPSVPDFLHYVVGESSILPSEDGVGAGLLAPHDGNFVLMPAQQMLSMINV